MKQTLESLVMGLLASGVLLFVAYATDGGIGHAHWIRDLFIGPPIWLLQTVLPAINPSFAIRGGQVTFHHLLATFILFWWAVGSAMLAMSRHKPPTL